MDSFAQFSLAARSQIDEELDSLLPKENISPFSVHAAMRWSVFAGGKRFRPLLLLATGEAFGASRQLLLPSACALELLHTYSLIHDDLPSMDNDDLRRGQPTCHVKFGEATAILAGDALQALAFQTVADDSGLSFETRVRLASEIAKSAGTPDGMVAGQAHDLAAETRDVRHNELEEIHRLKTGALINAASRSGAIIAGVTDRELDVVSKFGSHLGLLFQITDDLLDVTATAEILGKTPGKDARSQKATYPGVYGLEAAKDRARQAHAQARSTLNELERPTLMLAAIADFLLDRES
jgi:geranylgeranyl pyrophosphate synthase